MCDTRICIRTLIALIRLLHNFILHNFFLSFFFLLFHFFNLVSFLLQNMRILFTRKTYIKAKMYHVIIVIICFWWCIIFRFVLWKKFFYFRDKVCLDKEKSLVNCRNQCFRTTQNTWEIFRKKCSLICLKVKRW